MNSETELVPSPAPLFSPTPKALKLQARNNFRAGYCFSGLREAT
jgi:hypothetical protein